MSPTSLNNLLKNQAKNEKKITAAELRKKIAIDTSLSGKGLVDLAKEGK